MRRKEDLIEEGEFLEANPSYAHIRFKDGCEDTVVISDLPRYPQDVPSSPVTGETQLAENTHVNLPEDEVEMFSKEDDSKMQGKEQSISDNVPTSNNGDNLSIVPRCSPRIRCPVGRLT